MREISTRREELVLNAKFADPLREIYEIMCKKICVQTPPPPPPMMKVSSSGSVLVVCSHESSFECKTVPISHSESAKPVLWVDMLSEPARFETDAVPRSESEAMEVTRPEKDAETTGQFPVAEIPIPSTRGASRELNDVKLEQPESCVWAKQNPDGQETQEYRSNRMVWDVD